MLVVEVSDTTLFYDRDKKVPLYARHGVPKVWVVDVQHAALVVYGGLRDGDYRRHVVLERPATVALDGLPGVVFDLAPIFAP